MCNDTATLIGHQSSTAVTIPSGGTGICLSTLLGTGLAHDCPVATHAAAIVITQAASNQNGRATQCTSLVN
eukprot:COSAG02_NODE_3555_length_6569_cov_36.053941_5_plen_71_part_00